MKILAIHIRNLASLEGNNVIDFTNDPLLSAGIFAITGSTGAGKSTILDALCLALYAQTPRYRLAENSIAIEDVKGSSIKQGDPRGILRDGAADGYAMVDFVGVDGKPYQATWSVRRARNKPDGNLQPYEMQLCHLHTGQPTAGKKTEILQEIERLVGLNFEQFTRSVLLAQGDFTAFMKAGKNEKSSLLERLTGTHIYSEISIYVFEQHREQELQLHDLNLRKENIPTLQSEELETLEKQKVLLHTQIQDYKKKIDNLEKAKNWRQQLADLQSELETAKQEYQLAEEDKKVATERLNYFQKINKVQPARPLYDKGKETQRQIIAKQKYLQDLTLKFDQLKGKKQKLEEAVREIESNVRKCEAAQKDAEPQLKKARELDTLLKEKKEQLQAVQNRLSETKKEERSLKQRFEDEQHRFFELKKNKEELNNWIEKHESRRPIAEQEQLIMTKLTDASDTLDLIKRLKIQLSETQQQSRKSAIQLKDLQNQQDKLEADLSSKRKDFQKSQSAYDLVSVENLEQKKLEIDEQVAVLTDAQAQWKLLYAASLDEKHKKGKVDETKSALKEENIGFLAAQEVLKKIILRREGSATLLKQAELAAAENIEDLRGELTEGDPCPVCGNSHHPYISENPQLRNVLREIRNKHAQLENSYTEKLQAESRLKQSCDHLQKEVATIASDLVQSTKKLQELTEEWSTIAGQSGCDKQPEDKREQWLQEQLTKQRETRDDLQRQIKHYYKQKQEADQQNEILSQLERQSVQFESRQKDVKRDSKSQEEKAVQYKEEQDRNLLYLTQLREKISIYLLADKWFEHWQEDPGNFTKRLKDFANKWRDNIQQLDEINPKLNTSEVVVSKVQEQFNSQSIERQRQEADRSGWQSKVERLAKERGKIFEGQSASDIELALKSAVAEAQNQQKAKHKEKEENYASFFSTQEQLEQGKEDLQHLSKEETANTTALKMWLGAFNERQRTMLSESDLEQLLSHDHEWIEAERATLQNIEEKVQKTQSVWKGRKNAEQKLADKNISDQSLDELLEELHAVQENNEEIIKKYHETDLSLRNDKKEKEKISGLLEAIQKQTEIRDNWAKLNDIIGSADGKKFRQIAQEYTLDMLLTFANKHLESLNDRYVLQRVPESLGLQVLDMDMGREIRTVFSLSGGESFLVSLALALGLASLSSNRMKVESLFIDEGFGALDPETLNIAMDALERLYNQGRKVGVISHVQEMMERIPVQIRVHKHQSGKSKLEIVEY